MNIIISALLNKQTSGWLLNCHNLHLVARQCMSLNVVDIMILVLSKHYYVIIIYANIL